MKTTSVTAKSSKSIKLVKPRPSTQPILNELPDKIMWKILEHVPQSLLKLRMVSVLVG